MHIADGILPTSVLATGAVVAAVGVGYGVWKTDPDRVPRAAVLSSAFFVVSLIPVPVPLAGTSAHLILNGLMGIVLGWAAFPAIAIALLLQAVFFQYGGPTTLGVNIMNMALPALVCHYVFSAIVRNGKDRLASLAGFGAGVFSILLALVLWGACLYTGGEAFGAVILVGATTENPFFTINSPLLSRSTVFKFEAIGEDDIVELLRRALADDERGLGGFNVKATDEALGHLATICDGDARRALTALEVGVLSQDQTTGKIVFDLTVAQESIQTKAVQYDSFGDQHYDAASALIKSMRGSDPDATVYWLARMLVAGEDPRFIARRIAILASEDVGNADPRAISVANAAFQITERIGMPECQLTLAQAAIYMACAPKSNSATIAIGKATEDVKGQRTVPVPKHLRNAPHPGMAEQYGYSKGYQYSHDYEGGVSPDQDYLGVDATYYTPTDRGYEKHMAAYLEWARQLREEG